MWSCSDFESVRMFRRYYPSPEVTKCPKPIRGLSRSEVQKHGGVCSGGASVAGGGDEGGGGGSHEEDQEEGEGLFTAPQL